MAISSGFGKTLPLAKVKWAFEEKGDMESDWTINNCMTFTFSVLASAAGRVGKDKSCGRAERRQAMAMASLAYLSCWHVSPSHIKSSLSSFAKKNNWINEE